MESLDHLEELVALITVASGESEEVPRPGEDESSLRCAGNTHPEPTAEIEQALLAQLAQSAKHRVRVHVHDCSEVLRGWKPLAGLCVAFADRPADLRRDLLMQRCRVRTI